MYDLRGHGRSAGSDDRGFVRDFELFVRDVGGLHRVRLQEVWR
jgi:alpha-beta hydrolase superfamily lysophospholipase